VCRGEQLGTPGLTKRKGIGQQADCLQPWHLVDAPLQIADGPHAQPGPLGQRLL